MSRGFPGESLDESLVEFLEESYEESWKECLGKSLDRLLDKSSDESMELSYPYKKKCGYISRGTIFELMWKFLEKKSVSIIISRKHTFAVIPFMSSERVFLKFLEFFSLLLPGPPLEMSLRILSRFMKYLFASILQKKDSFGIF